MNRARRTTLKRVLGKMEELAAMLDEVRENLQEVADEEEEALGNLPTSLQEGERGQQMQEYVDALSDVIDHLSELDMEDLYQQVEEIAEE